MDVSLLHSLPCISLKKSLTFLFLRTSMEALAYQQRQGLYQAFEDKLELVGTHEEFMNHIGSSYPIWNYTSPDKPSAIGQRRPIWQTSPYIGTARLINMDATTMTPNGDIALNSHSLTIDRWTPTPPGGFDSPHPVTRVLSLMRSIESKKFLEYEGDPVSLVHIPIYSTQDPVTQKPVADLMALVHWGSYFLRVLPQNIRGIHVVLKMSCGKPYTYLINGHDVQPLGEGDLHDKSYDHRRWSANFSKAAVIADGSVEGIPLNRDVCDVSIDIYPTDDFYDDSSMYSYLILGAVALVFVITAGLFILYDRLVERRQAIVLFKANQSNDLVSSLFPANVRERLMKAEQHDRAPRRGQSNRLKSFLKDSDDDNGLEPIADLFPNCTVLFADIVGFTAWSSSRDPSHVFVLLQAVYHEFDRIAKKRGVFKVETIGDAYVAVTGLPEPQEKHAIIMARYVSFFAADINKKCMFSLRFYIYYFQIRRRLSCSLGPDYFFARKVAWP